ncbi:hypothetical protein [Alienimonas sp. DA493]|uniref:hypothetical protein n=1 Tax=Alienimonas sp. DA493 TaxID=3373605 RepID=UPI00375490D9
MQTLTNAYCCNAASPPANRTAGVQPLGLPVYRPGAAPAAAQGYTETQAARYAANAAGSDDGPDRLTPADLALMGYGVNTHASVRDALREDGHDAGRDDRTLTDLLRDAGFDPGPTGRDVHEAIAADQTRRRAAPEPLGLPQWTPEPSEKDRPNRGPAPSSGPQPLDLPGW